MAGRLLWFVGLYAAGVVVVGGGGVRAAAGDWDVGPWALTRCPPPSPQPSPPTRERVFCGETGPHGLGEIRPAPPR